MHRTKKKVKLLLNIRGGMIRCERAQKNSNTSLEGCNDMLTRVNSTTYPVYTTKHAAIALSVVNLLKIQRIIML